VRRDVHRQLLRPGLRPSMVRPVQWAGHPHLGACGAAGGSRGVRQITGCRPNGASMCARRLESSGLAWGRE
jgi:hypothetical protein